MKKETAFVITCWRYRMNHQTASLIFSLERWYQFKSIPPRLSSQCRAVSVRIAFWPSNRRGHQETKNGSHFDLDPGEKACRSVRICWHGYLKWHVDCTCNRVRRKKNFDDKKLTPTACLFVLCLAHSIFLQWNVLNKPKTKMLWLCSKPSQTYRQVSFAQSCAKI